MSMRQTDQLRDASAHDLSPVLTSASASGLKEVSKVVVPKLGFRTQLLVHIEPTRVDGYNPEQANTFLGKQLA